MKHLIAVLFLSGLPLTAGELPELEDKPWVGWYCGYEGKNFDFGVGGTGQGVLIPLKDKEQVSSALWIRIHPVIVEVQPDGREYWKKIIEDGWEALGEASSEAEEIAYRATVEGGAKFEVIFEIDGDEVLGGGRIIEKGRLTQKPIRLDLRVKVPDYYRYKRDKDGYEKEFKRDRVELLMANGKKKKFDIYEEIDAAKVNDAEISSARIDFNDFHGARLFADSGDAGTFSFWNGGVKPLSMGFSLNWTADAAKSADGKARFSLKFK